MGILDRLFTNGRARPAIPKSAASKPAEIRTLADVRAFFLATTGARVRPTGARVRVPGSRVPGSDGCQGQTAKVESRPVIHSVRRGARRADLDVGARENIFER